MVSVNRLNGNGKPQAQELYPPKGSPTQASTGNGTGTRTGTRTRSHADLNDYDDDWERHQAAEEEEQRAAEEAAAADSFLRRHRLDQLPANWLDLYLQEEELEEAEAELCTGNHQGNGQSVPEMARQPNLMTVIMNDIATVGLVGDRLEGLLTYIAYSSRKRKKPLNLMFQGPSGKGKDELQRRPAELIPPEDVIDLVSQSPNFLYYLEPGSLKNKALLNGERSHNDSHEQRDRTAAVRQLMSLGYLTKGTVDRGAENKLESQRIYQEGPVAVTETTTLKKIFREDANRFLTVPVTRTPQEVRAIKQEEAKRKLPGPQNFDAAVKAAKKRHHAFQRALQDVEVRIPYALVLADLTPDEPAEVMRIFKCMLTPLIETVAFLHQFQRPLNLHNQLEATLGDYGWARQLILPSLHKAIGLGVNWEELEAFDKNLPLQQRFTSTEARAAAGTKTRKGMLSQLSKLVGAGILKCVEGGSSRKPSVYERTGVKVAEMLLPSVTRLRAAWDKARQEEAGKAGQES
jgi:hypothetical protein